MKRGATSDEVLQDWRYRWSRCCIVDGKWHVTYDDPDHANAAVCVRRWRWFRPDDWARMAMHKSWERRYW